MENNKSVFDELDSIKKQNYDTNEKIGELTEIVQALNSKINVTENKNDVGTGIVNNTKKYFNPLDLFLSKSRKEYVWVGSRKDYCKEGNALVILSVLLILVGVISTIVTSIALKFYSTFSLFENIYIIFAIKLIVYKSRLDFRVVDKVLAENSYERYESDKKGLMINTNKEKGAFKFFRIVSYISVVGNIIVLLIEGSGAIVVFAIILELVFIGLVIAMNIVKMNFYIGYFDIVLFTRTDEMGKPVTIVGSIMRRKFMSYDDFKKNFPFIET